MKMLFICVCVSLLSTCWSSAPDVGEESWDAWKTKYRKSYATVEEEETRRRAWEENADIVSSHNARDDVTYRLELNQFADQLIENPVLDPSWSLHVQVGGVHVEDVPKQFDWRDKGVVTPVRNTGPLGDAEAYVAAECVESFHAIQTGKLYELSIQEVWSCCQGDGLSLPVVADVFGCIHNIGGLCQNGTFHTSGRCDNSSCTAVAQVSGTKWVPPNDEDALLRAVLKVPVFATVNAGVSSFQLYTSGVYTDPACTGKELDHVLQVVGYGADDKGTPYWICRNTWGAEWGMKGYILLERGVNRCGIAATAKYPF